MQQVNSIRLSSARIRKMTGDKNAEAKQLIYVSDAEKGISRKKKGKSFAYFFGDARITDTEELLRIKSLVIPPAWRKVWICRHENGHLQATGIDARNRKQYKYHQLWTALRSHTKYRHLYEFGKALPAIRKQIEKDLALPGMPKEKVLALVVSLMERTHIRVGNQQYEKLYGSFGITTLKDEHVQFKKNKIFFRFTGKKGIAHEISLSSKRLLQLVKKCRDIPGKELFQYQDERKIYHTIDSGMVNSYIKELSGANFTAKDFRTWSGSLQALLFLMTLDAVETQSDVKANLVKMTEQVSSSLGNTRNVCRKYYIHPLIFDLYEKQGLEKYFTSLDAEETGKKHPGLSKEEQLLMQILEKETY